TTTTTNTSLPDLSGSAVSAPTWTTLTAPSGQFSKDLTGMDPMLRFLVATALFQEVKLLNTYIRDAAIDCNYEAFVVRLQIALAPVRRGLPLDTVIDLSFFPSDQDGIRLLQHAQSERGKDLLKQAETEQAAGKRIPLQVQEFAIQSLQFAP